MRNITLILLVVAFGMFLSGCKNEDNNPTPQPPGSTYSVSYAISVFGGYNDLEITYYDAGNLKKQISGPKTPWEKYLNNFIKIDSVAFRVAIMPLANRTVTYEYEVKITQGSEFINGDSGSQTIMSGENPEPVFINWAVIVE